MLYLKIIKEEVVNKMVNVEYSEAIVEVLGILESLRDEDRNNGFFL